MRGHTILGKVNPRQGMDCPARLPYNFPFPHSIAPRHPAVFTPQLPPRPRPQTQYSRPHTKKTRFRNQTTRLGTHFGPLRCATTLTTSYFCARSSLSSHQTPFIKVAQFHVQSQVSLSPPRRDCDSTIVSKVATRSVERARLHMSP
jgi:hypothetical protein